MSYKGYLRRYVFAFISLFATLSVTNAAHAITKADFVFVVDATSSMGGEINAVRSGLQAFVQNLDSAEVDARFAVVLYGGAPELVQDFTASVTETEASFSQIRVNGPVTGFQHSHNYNPEAGLEAIRIVLNVPDAGALVRDHVGGAGPLVYRPDARKNIILVTDEDSDRPYYSFNRVPGQNGNEPPSGLNGDWQIEVDNTVDAVVENNAFLNLLINAGDNPSRWQYGDPDQDVADSDLLNYDMLATLANLETNGFGQSLQAQVLRAGLLARSFSILRVNSPDFINNFFAAKVEETVENALFPVIQAIPNPARPNQEIAFDGTASFHQLEGHNIVAWDWDFDNDGIYDASAPIATYSFAAAGTYPVTLRVTDDADTPAVATAVVNIVVSDDPLPPTADAGGPYYYCPQTSPWLLSGSGSVNPDDGESESGTIPDAITAYAWDLDNDGQFDDGVGETIDVSDFFAGLGTGQYLVRLNVTDNTADAFPSSGLGDLNGQAATTVSVLDAADARCNCLTDLAARPKATKVQLTWTDTGAARYNVYRSDDGGVSYQLIAQTSSRYSTYLDLGLTLDMTYRYVVNEVNVGGVETCQSPAVEVTPTARRIRTNNPPSITSTPVLTAQEGVNYSYDVEAVDPDRRDSITYILQLSPSGMDIDPVTGLINWIPSNAQVGDQSVIVRAVDGAGLFAQQTFTVSVANQNQAPQIISSPLTTGRENSQYSYAVSAIDPDMGDVLTYGLTQAPTGMAIDASTGLIAWMPATGAAGLYDITVTVRDQAGLTDAQSYQLSIAQENLAPVIGSTPVTTATETQTYQYDVDATDPNPGDSVNYALVMAPSGMTIDADTGLITWVPGEADIGAAEVTVSALDQHGAASSQTYTVQVSYFNDAPTITSVAESSAAERQLYQYDVNATDPDLPAGDILTYALDVSPVGMSIDSGNGLIQWTPDETQVGTHPVTVRVIDSQGLSATQSFNIIVANLPDAPRITSTPVTSATEGVLYQYDADAVDPDVGDVIAYSLSTTPTGMTIDPVSGLIQWTPTNSQVGDNTVVVSVTDTTGLSVSQSFVITVVNVNEAPTITSTPNSSATQGSVYQYPVIATDPDSGDTLTYALDVMPAGMTIDAGGVIAWTPSEEQVGVQTVTVRVSDSGGLSDAQTFTVNVANQPNPPVFTSTPVTTADEGTAYVYDADATDSDVGDTLTYSLDTAPAGMTIDAATGVINWSPSGADVGTQDVVVRVTDSDSLFATQSYGILVTDVPYAPVITSTPVTTAAVDVAYSYDVEASDADGDVLSYSLVEAPSGMAIDGTSGLISWTPTSAQVGSHPVTLQVDDGNGGTATQSYTVAVAAAPNTAPNITSTPATTAMEGVAYSYDVDATDADGDTLSYSLVTAPSGMTIDGTSGLVSWTPSAAQVGSHPVSVQADDGNGGTTSQSYTLVVTAAANSGPVISSIPPTQATTGMAYSYAVAATDPDGDTLSFSLITAPTGMSVDSATGLVSWTPSSAQVGGHAVTVRVDDGQAFVEQSYSIAVSSDALPLDVFISLSSQNVDLGNSVTVTVISEGGLQPAALTLTVDGTTVALDGAGQAILPGDAIGTYHLVATAADTRETVDARSYYTVRDPSDNTAPTAVITTPTTDTELTAPAQVIGTADDVNLAEYKLLVSPADRNQYTEIAHGTTPVLNGVLGTFDPTQLENGIYDVGLIVTDVNGLQSSTVVQYQVSGDMKVGNFSFTLEDLSIPVAGIPITVSRTYDTRKRFSDLDFGYGWTIDYQSVKVEENIELGLNWTQTSSGGFFPNYCVEPVGAHVVTVTLPDGKVEEFDMGVTPRCNTLIPLQFVDPVFTARAGTGSTLVAENVGQLWYNGGTLLDPGDFDTYDPARYTLTTAEGYVYALDQNFGIRTVTDPNGNTLTYSSSGIVHSSGKSVTFSRDGQGRITHITDPNGNAIDYAYNANGDLASVTNQVGEVTRHRYNRSHGLTEYIDPRGITPARNIYDDEGRLVATEDADGNRIELTHDVTGRQEVLRDRLGNVTLVGYDDSGYVTSETDALGNTTSYARDARGNELSKTDALGNTITKSFDINDNPLTETDALGNTITRSYNSRNQLLTSTDKNGNVTSKSYDNSGNLTQLTDPLGGVVNNSYDSSGNMTATTDAGGYVTAFTYDASGNKASETDPLGNAVTFQYDANGNQTGDSRTRTDAGVPVTVTTQKVYDAANRVITEVDGEGYSSETEYNALGKDSAKIDRNGNRTEFDYDARGNLIRTRYADGSQSAVTYDAEGNKVSETDQSGNTTSYEYDALKRLLRTTYADGSQVSNSYDAAGRLIAVTDALGNVTSHEYDALGQRTRVTDPLGNQTSYTYDANGNQLSVTDANGHTTIYDYDALNRRIRTIFPDGSQINVSYDALGRKTAETDQAGVVTQYAYDALGRLTQVTDALTGITSYTYDEFGNKLTQTDAEGRTTSWTYDNVGNVLSRSLPLGQVETFTYDGYGNKLTHTDFNGDTVSFSYDSLNRLVLKTYPNASTVAYSYTATGKVAGVSDVNGTTNYSYDSRDRLVRVDNPDGSFIAYAYDAMGNRTELTTPAGTAFYTFDALSRLESVTDVNGGVTVYTYDAAGNRASVNYPNGSLTSYSYDSLNRLIYLENSRSDTSIISSYQYTLGAAGNRTRIVEHDGRTVDYVYDALYRLVSEQVTDLVNGDSRVDYTYDAVGNRLTKEVDSLITLNYSYDGNDRLLSEGATSYSYDANGNLLSKNDGTLTSYVYDVDSRLVQVQTPTRTLDYGYDVDGIRQSVSIDGIVTKHLVDKNRDHAQVIEEWDAANTLLVVYTHGDDLISQDRSGISSYYHYDGLGSTRALTDSSETATDTYTYEAFGSLTRSTGTTENSYLYTGEQFDPNTGFYYLRARYMSPEDGRFLGMDPFSGLMHEPITLHKYLYAGLNPVSNIDPSGEFFGGFSFGGFGLSLSIGLRLYASNALFYGAPLLYLVQRVLMRVNVAFLTRLVNLATARFYQSAQTTLINSGRILRLDAGRAFERLVNPAMRLIGAARHRPIPGAIPDWIYRGRHIIDAKLGQSVNIGQLRHFVNWAGSRGGNVVYVTLTRTPPSVVQRAREIGQAQGVVVNFISLTPF